MTACRLSLWLSGEMAQPGGSEAEAYAQPTNLVAQREEIWRAKNGRWKI